MDRYHNRLIIGVITVAFWSQSAVAADFSTVLTDQSGAPLMVAMDKTGTPVPMTLGVAAEQALFASFPDETTLSDQEKFHRGTLGLKIGDAKGTVDLPAEDTALIKKLIAKAFGPLVVARAWPLLDPASTAVSK